MIFVIAFLLLTCRVAIWPSMFNKNVKTSMMEKIQDKRSFFIILSLTFLSCYLRWTIKTGVLISFFVSAYLLFLCHHICYWLAKWKMRREGQELELVLDTNGYVKCFLVGGGIWLISSLAYVIYIRCIGYSRLSLLDYMNYSLLPWLTVVHELYPSKYLLRSRKVSRLLLLASAVDVVLMWMFNFK